MTKNTVSDNVRSGKFVSRGKRGKQHGKSKTPTYSTWKAMRVRCYRKSYPYYRNYGGRGIKVCARWDSFLNFLADMGEKPAGRSLERINNDGDYTPDNCCWASAIQQSRNTRRNHRITFNGKTRSLSEWTEQYGVRYKMVVQRLQYGWSFEYAMFSKPNRTLQAALREGIQGDPILQSASQWMQGCLLDLHSV